MTDGKAGDKAIRGDRHLKVLFQRLRRHLPDYRPLQIDEVTAAVVDAVRRKALPGIRALYLPSALKVLVSPEDFRYVCPFINDLEANVQQELRSLASEDGGEPWRGTVEDITMRMSVDHQLRTGAPPTVVLQYSGGMQRASWSPRRTADPVPDRADVLLTVVTTLAEGYETALQETANVWLGRELPAYLLNKSISPGVTLRIRGGTVVDEQGDPWLVDGRQLSVEPPPDPCRVPSCLPPVWDAPWAWLEGSFGRPLLWCPGGVVILGREHQFAHLIPTGLASAVSAAHVALWSDIGGLVVCDLESTNGTIAGRMSLAPGRPTHVDLPAVLQVGSLGSLVIEIRRSIVL